jgi:hypothetical protein
MGVSSHCGQLRELHPHVEVGVQAVARRGVGASADRDLPDFFISLIRMIQGVLKETCFSSVTGLLVLFNILQVS